MKNNIKIGMRLLPFLAGVLLLASCTNDPISDYYNQKDITMHEGTVLDGLKENPDYSEFLALLMETGVDKELIIDNLVTVWVPKNGMIPDTVYHMNLADKKLFVENHISSSIISVFNLNRMPVVRTLAEKALTVEIGIDEETSETVYRVDGVAVSTDVQLFNQRYANGIVHEMASSMLPRKNLYQFIRNLDDDTETGDKFGQFKQLILSYNKIVFDSLNSPIAGIDPITKKIYYDSIKIEVNEVLDAINPKDETARIVMMMPTNDALKDMKSLFRSYLEGVNYPITDENEAEEEQKWLDWFAKACLIVPEEGKVISSTDSLISVHGMNLKMGYQTVEDIISISNGEVYTLTECYVPRTIYFGTQIISPWHIRMTTANTDSKAGTPFYRRGPALEVFDNEGDQVDWWTRYSEENSHIFSEVQEVRFQFIPSKKYDSDIRTKQGNLYDENDPEGYRCRYVVKSAMPERGLVDDIGIDETVVKMNIMPGYYEVWIRLGNTTTPEPNPSISQTDAVRVTINGANGGETILVTGINNEYVDPEKRKRIASPIKCSSNTGHNKIASMPYLGPYDYQQQGGKLADKLQVRGSYGQVTIEVEIDLPDPGDDAYKIINESYTPYTRLTLGRITLIPLEYDNY